MTDREDIDFRQVLRLLQVQQPFATTHNTPINDLEQDANLARPIIAGGTGATTAADAIQNLGGQVINSTRTVTANTTVVAATDNNALIKVNATSGEVTIALPTAASLGDGFQVAVKKIDSGPNVVTINPAGNEQIDGSTTLTLSQENESVIIRCDGTSFNSLGRETGVATGPVLLKRAVLITQSGTFTPPQAGRARNFCYWWWRCKREHR